MAAPRKVRGASSFATLIIIGPVCFFLGILFAQFPYDYPLLWTSAPIEPSFIDQISTHITFIFNSPPLIGRLLNIVMVVGLLGFLVKLFNPTEANVLFDGASLVLYLIGAGIYLTNIMKGLRSVGTDIWSQPGWDTPEDGSKGLILGKEDSLKVLSASNTILALVLVGVLVLQAGQWYAESKEKEEQDQIDKDYNQKLKAAAAGGSNKKKQ